MDGVTIGANSTGAGNDSISVSGTGTSDMNMTLRNSALTASRGDLFDFIANGTGGGDLDFHNNDLSNNHPAIGTGGGGMIVRGGAGSGTLDVNISSGGLGANTFRDSLTHALMVQKSEGTGGLTGTIDGNQIGLAGTANSGSLEGDGFRLVQQGGGPVTLNITNNQIRQYNNFGMELK